MPPRVDTTFGAVRLNACSGGSADPDDPGYPARDAPADPREAHGLRTDEPRRPRRMRRERVLEHATDRILRRIRPEPRNRCHRLTLLLGRPVCALQRFRMRRNIAATAGAFRRSDDSARAGPSARLPLHVALLDQ